MAKGNEKGDVENLCKRSERTYLSPPPHIDGLDQLAGKLFDACQDDLKRQGPAAHSDKTVGELLAQERVHLLPLQAERFEACIRRASFIDSHSLFLADTFRYSVPVRWAHHPCVAKMFVDRVEIFCQQQKVAVHPRRYRGGKFVLEPTHYLKLLQRKPGSLDNAMAFKGQPWGEEFDLMRKELEYRYEDDGTLRYINILLLFTEYPEADVKEAVGLCVKRRAFSEEAVLNVLRERTPEPQGAIRSLRPTGMAEPKQWDS